jgi:tight adherence protein C
MLALFILSLFITTFCITHYISTKIYLNPKRQLMMRISKHVRIRQKNGYDTPLLVRLFNPLIEIIVAMLERFTPKKYKLHLQHKVLKTEGKFTFQKVLLSKFLLLVLTLISLILYSNLYNAPNLLFFLLVPLSYFLPDLGVNQYIKKRKFEILAELPLLIDTLGIILAGGIAFDNAIQKICERKNGPLYSEFKYFIKEVRMGLSREEALKNLALRTQLPEMDSLVRSLIQGEKMGISIITTIQLQSHQLRLKRRQRIQEQAMKIPVKILIPLVLFIFPPIFLIILGPGAIQIIENLG